MLTTNTTREKLIVEKEEKENTYLDLTISYKENNGGESGDAAANYIFYFLISKDISTINFIYNEKGGNTYKVEKTI